MLKVSPGSTGRKIVTTTRPDIGNPILLMSFATECVIHIAWLITRLSCICPYFIALESIAFARVPRAHYMRAPTVEVNDFLVMNCMTPFGAISNRHYSAFARVRKR